MFAVGCLEGYAKAEGLVEQIASVGMRSRKDAAGLGRVLPMCSNVGFDLGEWMPFNGGKRPFGLYLMHLDSIR
jgi:hypothetical protein